MCVKAWFGFGRAWRTWVVLLLLFGMMMGRILLYRKAEEEDKQIMYICMYVYAIFTQSRFLREASVMRSMCTWRAGNINNTCVSIQEDTKHHHGKKTNCTHTHIHKTKRMGDFLLVRKKWHAP